MSTRMEIKSWRKSRNGKAYAVRIGSTWTNEKGVTYLEFDALPLPDEQGRVSCFLEEPRERTQDAAPSPSKPPQAPDSYAAARGMTGKSAGASPMRPAVEDSIPFEMEYR